MTRIPGLDTLSEYLPDPAYPATEDVANRNHFYYITLTLSQDLVNEPPALGSFDEPVRIRSVQVAPVAGTTGLTAQIKIDDRPIFDTAELPGAGGEIRTPAEIYIVQAGAVIESEAQGWGGAPTANMVTLIEAEPYILLPRFDEVQLHGKDRLRPSKQQRAAEANTGRVLVEQGRVAGASPVQSNAIAARQLETLRRIGQHGRAVESPPITRPGLRTQPRPQ